MNRSKTVTLTLVTTLSFIARGQQLADPCDSASFNAKACKAAIHSGGFCSQGTWVPASYQQKYPFYYDLFQDYVSQGGAVVPADVCATGHTPFSTIRHGGFGSTGSGHSAHC